MKQYARGLVEHPEYHARFMKEHEQLVRAMEVAEADPTPTPTEFPRLIDDLLSHHKHRVNVAGIHLRKVAAPAEQLLLAVLEDPRATPGTPRRCPVGCVVPG